MAQLNPNFEIDFNDINSYEQIQLINDTQLAKENLLMHKAYKEPSDDAIIRNRFSSFTFVDFCPKLFTSCSSTAPCGDAFCSCQPSSSQCQHRYELENFSDLFERINNWLELNKDWRVISIETLVFDCKSQFNQVKSSIYAQHLPRNMRGLRLYLSPTKSRFVGAQKIGCINVVPRQVSDSDGESEVRYETLDQILDRLNELLLTRPIEGRILSVETITLPIKDGYVKTESNYFMDSMLNSIDQRVHSPVISGQFAKKRPRHALIDILRVYYEFGPIVCGLVNLIDFIPRFHRTAVSSGADQHSATLSDHPLVSGSAGEQPAAAASRHQIDSTESLTRLVRRSLAWFESECKQVARDSPNIQLKLCNLQVHGKVLLKHKLVRVDANNAIEILRTRQMYHELARRLSDEPLNCGLCPTRSTAPAEWCPHLADLCEPYEVKFVRLAYVVPVHNFTGPLLMSSVHQDADDETSSSSSSSDSSSTASSSSQSSLGEAPLEARTEAELEQHQLLLVLRATNERHSANEQQARVASAADSPTPPSQTNLSDGLIGQLTYRLFAPCQLVNSSSCFSINPINSSSPLARRGSVDLNGGCSGSLSSDNAQPAVALASLLGGSQQQLVTGGSGTSASPQQHALSFGAFFPSLSSHDIIPEQLSHGALVLNKAMGGSGSSSSASQRIEAGNSQIGSGNTLSKFTHNEFESVDAIKRRMEVYVTTNSMKVIAGETLVVNLSDALSCLSTAIEQTIMRAPFAASRQPSTWVSVYILYAAVDEPHLPSQLLEQQRKRDRLEQISEEWAAEQQHERQETQLQQHDKQDSSLAGEDNLEPVFDDDFKCEPVAKVVSGGGGGGSAERMSNEATSQPEPAASDQHSIPSLASDDKEHSVANDDTNHDADNAAKRCIYNCAYERAVALPSSPNNQLTDAEYLEPVEAKWGDGHKRTVDDSDEEFDILEHYDSSLDKAAENLKECCERRSGLELSKEQRRRLHQRQQRKGKKSAGRRKRHDAQCSIV